MSTSKSILIPCHSCGSRNPDIEFLDARLREHDKQVRLLLRLAYLLPAYIPDNGGHTEVIA